MTNKAKWIWHKSCYENNEYVDFLIDLQIGTLCENTIFHISVDSEYVLWINGVFVDCGQYDDYPEHKSYDSLNIGNLLKKGMNRIAVQAYYQGEPSFQYAKGERALCFWIVNGKEHFVSDEKVLCRISNTYQSGEIYKTTDQLGFAYCYDASKDDNWQDLSYIYDDTWKYAIVKHISTILYSRPVDKLVIKNSGSSKIIAQGYIKRDKTCGNISDKIYTDFLSHRPFEQLFTGNLEFPVKVKSIEADGIYMIADLGRERCGFVTISIDTSEGTIVEFGYGEHLKDLRVRCKVGERNFANEYRCRNGEQTFTHYFKRIAGRYIELHIRNFSTLSISYIGLNDVSYKLADTSKFSCSDSLHNEIFRVCVDTLKLCVHEHYEDCPWREQALYSFDSRNQMLFGYYAFGEYNMPKASLELLGERLKENGQLNICAPTDETLTIPSFSVWWLLAVKEYVEFSGDFDFAEKYWSQIDSMSQSYVENIENGLIQPPSGKQYWHFYEWSNGCDGCDTSFENLRNNPLFLDGNYQVIMYLVLNQTVALARLMHKIDYVEKFQKILVKMKEAFNSHFWDNDKKVFVSYVVEGKMVHYGELMQSLALYSQICGQDKKEHLCNALTNENDLEKITLSFAIFKYEALLKHSHQYAKYVFDDVAKKWGYMLFCGATSFWETIKGETDFDNAGSLCHGWSTAPLYLYLRYISGITPNGKTQPIKTVFEHVCAEAKLKDESYHVNF